ncbi:transmembrane signal receptor [Lithospermum erythrorhizon]|uniref:Transmembrane signal receptor n=1 Tax=Lithospermum erythrorhizon TaxID=34254 RepID=A0AAV3S3W4_LITER
MNFWGGCVLAAVHLINRTLTPVLDGKTPYEILFKQPPSLSTLRVFGCLCYVANRPRIKDNFAPRSRKCMFVGYPFGQKGWRVFDLETREFFVSRDVEFCEDIFPCLEVVCDSKDTQWNAYLGQPSLEADMTVVNNDHIIPPNFSEENDAGVVQDRARDDLRPMPSSHEVIIGTMPSSPIQIERNSPTTVTENLGKGHRVRQPSSRLKDYVTHAVCKIDPNTSSALSAQSFSSGKQFNIASYVDYNNFSTRHKCFLTAITKGNEPSSYKEASQDPGWRQAMTEEIDALERNSTWTLEDLPRGKKAIGCGWVYKIKYHASGDIERLKARLVVFGYRKVEGIDYNETFAPVAKMSTIRVFLSVVVARNWELS